MVQDVMRFFTLLTFLSVSILSSVCHAEDATGFEGMIEPYELIEVGTAAAGVVEQVKVERSAAVIAGQPLVLLEASVERAALERAKALAECTAELLLQQERLAYAQRSYSRISELFRGEAISAEKRDQAKTEVEQAKTQLMKAKENILLAKLDLERAQTILDRRTINRPVTGVVVARHVSQGEYVADEPLMTIAQMDPLRVEVILPADMFTSIHPGMQAEIIPETEPQSRFSATTTIVDRVIDPASGTFGVRLELPNPDYRLPSGLKCTVYFQNLPPAPPSPEPGNQG